MTMFTETPKEFDFEDMQRIAGLCSRLTNAAKKLGPCSEAMACVEVQHELMRVYNTIILPEIVKRKGVTDAAS